MNGEKKGDFEAAIRIGKIVVIRLGCTASALRACSESVYVVMCQGHSLDRFDKMSAWIKMG